MPFRDLESGELVTAQVPSVFSPFMIDGVVADVGVRHMPPVVLAGDVVISVSPNNSQGGRFDDHRHTALHNVSDI
jgi:hypothetical protein